MRKCSIFLASLLLLLANHLCSVSSAPADGGAGAGAGAAAPAGAGGPGTDIEAVYGNLLKCLEENTPPAEKMNSSLVVFRANASYPSVLQAYVRNARINSTTNRPLVIITPTQISHVQAAVICTKKAGYQLKIRSGGHDYEGISYISDQPYFILDMFNLRSIEIDMKDESMWVQAGALLGEVYYRIWEQSKVHGYPAGVCPTVGVGGHVSGGGYGTMIRKYGLAVDHVVDAKFVNAKGELLDRKGMGEDVFWAIRGGGGASFGVVVAYKMNLVQVPPKVTVFRKERTLEENATDIVFKWQTVAPATADELFMRLLLQPVNSKVQKGTKTVRAAIMALYLGNADSLVTLMGKDFPELGLKKEDCMEMSWIESVLWWANFDNGTNPNVLLDRIPEKVNFLKRKSDYLVEPMPREGLELLWKKMIELEKPGLVFNAYGGKMNQVPPEETPVPHRAGNLCKLQYSTNWDEPGPEAENKYLTQMRDLFEFMTPYVSKNPRRAFLNYRDLDIGVMPPGKSNLKDGSVYGVKYFNGNFDRLVKIKTAVDPENFFRHQQSIPTSTS